SGVVEDRQVAVRAGPPLALAVVDARGPLFGVGGLVLDASPDDRTRMRQWIASELLRATGAPGPRIGFAHLVVDGADRRIVTNTEPYDATFLARAFGTTAPLYAGDDDIGAAAGAFTTLAGDDDHGDVQALLARLAFAPDTSYVDTAVGQRLDWAQVVRMLA